MSAVTRRMRRKLKMCSRQFDSTLKRDENTTTVITIVTKHPLTGIERNLLYRHIWGWSENQCIEPLSVKVEEKKNG